MVGEAADFKGLTGSHLESPALLKAGAFSFQFDGNA